MNMTSARHTARTVTIAATAALLLTGCFKSSPSSSSTSPPTCPASARTATGDLVPRGPRPCLLTTTAPGGHQAPALQDTVPAARQPATPDVKATAKQPTPDRPAKARAAAPASAKKR